MSRSSWVIIGGVIAVIVAMGLLTVQCPHGDPFHSVCRNNLLQIGGLLLTRQAAGTLEPLAGPAFLLQMSDDLIEADRVVFLCPEDPIGKACSYTGPDLQTARAFVEGTLPKPVILACDREAFHDTGVTVLWSTGKVEFLPWREIRGAESGDVVPVGPTAPDPRFRHLVR